MRLRLIAPLMIAMWAFNFPFPIASMAHNSTPEHRSETAATVDGKTEIRGVSYHYLIARGGPETVVLLHGWGTTSYMWRHVMPQLVAQGYTVIAPDLRGLGDTAKPADGYEKASIAEDIRALVTGLGVGPTINLVGHDMGGMIVYAYAAQHPNEVETLTIIDVPLPGIAPWDELVQGPRTWHFRFHSVRDLPEMLIAGRELEYLKWFHNVESVNARAFDNETDQIYGRAYAQPGALRAGFEYYRAFPSDIERNKRLAVRKLSMPVLAMSGAGGLGEMYEAHIRNVAEDVRSAVIKGSGHWIPEEKPQDVVEALLKFLPSPK